MDRGSVNGVGFELDIGHSLFIILDPKPQSNLES